MKLVASLAVLFFASELHTAEELTTWTDVLQDPVFVRFLTLATGERLQNLLSPRCLEAHGPDFGHLLTRLPFPVRISTNFEGCNAYGHCHRVPFSNNNLLLIWCEHYDMSQEMLRVPYKNVIALLSDLVRTKVLSVKDESMFRDPHYTYLQHRGVYTIFRKDSQIMLTKDSQLECISCIESRQVSSWAPHLLEQLPLRGAQLKISRQYPLFCEHPTYGVLLDIITQKNASFPENHYARPVFGKKHYSPEFIRVTNEVILNNEMRPEWNLGFPMTAQPLSYISIGLTLFAKRRYPLPKATILILPFSQNVWMALLCGMLLSASAIYLTLWANKKVFSSAHGVAFALIASLLQQSDQLSYKQQNLFSTRFLLALWSFTGLVLVTGYKGSLTALLRDVPLEPENPNLPNRSSPHQQGYVLHLFRLEKLRNDTSYENAAKIVKTEFLRLRKLTTVADKRYFEVVYEFMGRHTPTIRRCLGQFDYVPTGEPLFPKVTGPEIMYASPFREAFAKTVSQAPESGLFSRAEALHEFQIKHQSYSPGASSDPGVLTLGDLAPFFLVLSAGLGASVLSLLLEGVTAYLRVLCVKRRLRRRRRERLALNLVPITA